MDKQNFIKYDACFLNKTLTPYMKANHKKWTLLCNINNCRDKQFKCEFK